MKNSNQIVQQQARPTFEINFNDKVMCFDSSVPSIHGDSIMIIGLPRRIILYALDFGNEEFTFDYRTIKELNESDTKIIKLCTQVIARDIVFATLSSNFIKIFSVNESDQVCLKVLEPHTSYINSLDFSEDYLVSGSDDHTCKIFSVKDNYEEHSVLQFGAAVTCVRFNPEEVNKVLISVKNGNLFIYCLKLRQSLYSFYTHAPLMHFDWSVKNPCIVAALANEQIFYFDISKPDVPIYSKRVNEIGKIISIHGQNPLVSAVICNRAGTELKVIHQKSTISNIFTTKLIGYGGNVAWHSSYLIAGSDRKICFFKIPIS